MLHDGLHHGMGIAGGGGLAGAVARAGRLDGVGEAAHGGDLVAVLAKQGDKVTVGIVEVPASVAVHGGDDGTDLVFFAQTDLVLEEVGGSLAEHFHVLVQRDPESDRLPDLVSGYMK